MKRVKLVLSVVWSNSGVRCSKYVFIIVVSIIEYNEKVILK